MVLLPASDFRYSVMMVPPCLTAPVTRKASSTSPNAKLPARIACISYGRMPVQNSDSKLSLNQESGSFSIASKNFAASSAMSGSMRGLLCLNTRLRKRA